MNPYEIDTSIYRLEETRMKVRETAAKMWTHFNDHSEILISVSGGSDSDCIVHFVCKYFPEMLYKCHFVFVNTGLEYEATKRHLCDLEQKYGIQIERIRGRPIPAVVKEYGVPLLNKAKCGIISAYVRGLPWGEARIKGETLKGRATNSTHSMYVVTENQMQMAVYCKEHGIKVSARCCDESKKKPIYKYMKEHGIDLNVTGERKAEGGQRAYVHKTCFEQHDKKTDKYMPLWWWDNDDKADFKSAEGIVYSDCYGIYGMCRTGCCGCPFSRDVAADLQIMKHYEPKLYRACMAVFGEAYRLTDMFHCRRKKCLPEFEQMMLSEEAIAQEQETG